METIDIPCRINTDKLTSLKEKAAMHKPTLTWETIAEVVKLIAGQWGGCFNHIRSEEISNCFDFTKDERIHHLAAIEALLDVGSSLLLIIHQVEDDSNPHQDLTDLNSSITSALRSLTISRSAFSQPIENIEFSSFNV